MWVLGVWLLLHIFYFPGLHNTHTHTHTRIYIYSFDFKKSNPCFGVFLIFSLKCPCGVFWGGLQTWNLLIISSRLKHKKKTPKRKKLQNNKDSILFNQTCLNEKMLPKCTFVNIYIYIYIYIYI